MAASAAFAGFSVQGTKFSIEAADAESNIDSIIVFKGNEDAFLTYKSTEPFKFTWIETTIAGDVTERKVEEEAVDSTWVPLSDMSLLPSMGFALKFEEDSIQTVWAFRYEDYMPKVDTVVVTTDVEDKCDFFQLNIYPKDEEPAPAMEYINYDKEVTPVFTVKQHMMLRYDSTYYAEKSYETEDTEYPVRPDFEKFESVIDFTIPSPLDSTAYTVFPNQFAYEMSLDSITSVVVKPVAIETHVFASVRIREDARNENDKGDPKDPQESEESALQLKGSAPLVFEALNYPSPAAFHYVWILSQDKEYKSPIIKSYDRDFRYTFNEKGTYYLKVEVSNSTISYEPADGCTEIREFQIEVRESSLEVPNVFTPNGDGRNDEFKVAYRSIIKFHGWIYSQWGRLVYEWTDPAQGWDGTINGKPAADGAYMYIIEATGDDYDSEGKRVKYLKRGSVSIVR